MRGRWALLLAPAAPIAAIELARLDAVGPTVDAVRPIHVSRITHH